MINFWRNSNVRTKDRKEAKKNDENKKKKIFLGMCRRCV